MCVIIVVIYTPCGYDINYTAYQLWYNKNAKLLRFARNRRNGRRRGPSREPVSGFSTTVTAAMTSMTPRTRKTPSSRRHRVIGSPARRHEVSAVHMCVATETSFSLFIIFTSSVVPCVLGRSTMFSLRTLSCVPRRDKR